MLWIDAVEMTAVPNPGKNWKPFIDWLGKSFSVEVALPRKTLGISVLDDKRLSHSAVSATNARLRVVHFDAPNMPATVTYRFVLFHRISVPAPLESLRFGNKGHKLEALARERRLGAGRLFAFLQKT
jgi:hypothetical protein